ncbi:hypothetical protein CCR75_006954 [Bremia lactucae]|uniref:TRP C-terminal domain-containing protein n=1 Tax=Bremia lactucae TaxID=4779 RepID=A0A976IJG7_BRELC|nr:hypothetical protein CCR75_006954 [Bremia lactucae]
MERRRRCRRASILFTAVAIAISVFWTGFATAKHAVNNRQLEANFNNANSSGSSANKLSFSVDDTGSSPTNNQVANASGTLNLYIPRSTKQHRGSSSRASDSNTDTQMLDITTEASQPPIFELGAILSTPKPDASSDPSSLMTKIPVATTQSPSEPTWSTSSFASDPEAASKTNTALQTETILEIPPATSKPYPDLSNSTQSTNPETSELSAASNSESDLGSNAPSPNSEINNVSAVSNSKSGADVDTQKKNIETNVPLPSPDLNFDTDASTQWTNFETINKTLTSDTDHDTEASLQLKNLDTSDDSAASSSSSTMDSSIQNLEINNPSPTTSPQIETDVNTQWTIPETSDLSAASNSESDLNSNAPSPNREIDNVSAVSNSKSDADVETQRKNIETNAPLPKPDSNSDTDASTQWTNIETINKTLTSDTDHDTEASLQLENLDTNDDSAASSSSSTMDSSIQNLETNNPSPTTSPQIETDVNTQWTNPETSDLSAASNSESDLNTNAPSPNREIDNVSAVSNSKSDADVETQKKNIEINAPLPKPDLNSDTDASTQWTNIETINKTLTSDTDHDTEASLQLENLDTNDDSAASSSSSTMDSSIQNLETNNPSPTTSPQIETDVNTQWTNPETSDLSAASNSESDLTPNAPSPNREIDNVSAVSNSKSDADVETQKKNIETNAPLPKPDSNSDTDASTQWTNLETINKTLTSDTDHDTEASLQLENLDTNDDSAASSSSSTMDSSIQNLETNNPSPTTSPQIETDVNTQWTNPETSDLSAASNSESDFNPNAPSPNTSEYSAASSSKPDSGALIQNLKTKSLSPTTDPDTIAQWKNQETSGLSAASDLESDLVPNAPSSQFDNYVDSQGTVSVTKNIFAASNSQSDSDVDAEWTDPETKDLFAALNYNSDTAVNTQWSNSKSSDSSLASNLDAHGDLDTQRTHAPAEAPVTSSSDLNFKISLADGKSLSASDSSDGSLAPTLSAPQDLAPKSPLPVPNTYIMKSPLLSSHTRSEDSSSVSNSFDYSSSSQFSNTNEPVKTLEKVPYSPPPVTSPPQKQILTDTTKRSQKSSIKGKESSDHSASSGSDTASADLLNATDTPKSPPPVSWSPPPVAAPSKISKAPSKLIFMSSGSDDLANSGDAASADSSEASNLVEFTSSDSSSYLKDKISSPAPVTRPPEITVKTIKATGNENDKRKSTFLSSSTGSSDSGNNKNQANFSSALTASDDKYEVGQVKSPSKSTAASDEGNKIWQTELVLNSSEKTTPSPVQRTRVPRSAGLVVPPSLDSLESLGTVAPANAVDIENASAEVVSNEADLESGKNTFNHDTLILLGDTGSTIVYTDGSATTTYEKYTRGDVNLKAIHDANGSYGKIVVGGGNRVNLPPGASILLSATSQEIHNALLYASYALGIVSAVLLIFFHLLALQRPPWLSNQSNGHGRVSMEWFMPNVWELVVAVGYMQHVNSISMLELTKAPQIVLDFTDSFSFVNLHITPLTTTTATEASRRLQLIILTGTVAFADRIGISEDEALLSSFWIFLAVVAALVVLFILIAGYSYYRHSISADASLTFYPRQLRKSFAMCVVGLGVAFWALSIFPLMSMASYELVMELRYRMGIGLAVALFCLWAVAVGGLCYVFISVQAIPTSEAFRFRNFSIWGTMYGASKMTFRYFFVVAVVIQGLLGIITGAVSGIPAQLVALIATHLLFVIVTVIIRPFASRWVVIVVVGLRVVAITNLICSFAFLTSNGLSLEWRSVVAQGFVIFNSLVFFVLFARYVTIFVLVLKRWSSYAAPESLMHSLQTCDMEQQLNHTPRDVRDYDQSHEGGRFDTSRAHFTPPQGSISIYSSSRTKRYKFTPTNLSSNSNVAPTPL